MEFGRMVGLAGVCLNILIINRGGNHPKGEYWNKGAPVYLCEITLKPVKDKLGRFIVRYIEESQ